MKPLHTSRHHAAAGKPQYGFNFSENDWVRIADVLALSPREREVVWMAFHGEIETDIARELGISAHTVHAHFRRIYNKLRINSRTDLVRYLAGVYMRMLRDPSEDK